MLNIFENCSDLSSISVDSANGTFDSRDNCNAIIETASNTLILGCANTVIPSSVKSIGRYSFSSCDGLTSIDIPEGVKSIGDNAFTSCKNLTSATIPSSVKSIDSYSFYSCDGLTSIDIPEGVTSIGDYAFAYCKNLTSATIPSSVTDFGNDVFYGTALYDNQPDGLVYIGNIVCGYKGNMPANTALAIREGTVSIAARAFDLQTNLTSVTLPSTMKYIGRAAFYYCNNMKAVYISDIESWWRISFGSSVSNPLSMAHHLYLNDQEIKDVVVPSSITSINDYVFQGCTGLTSVEIHEGVTSIGSYAFSGCSGISSFTIPNSVASIGEYALSGTSWLSNQPNGLVYAGNVAYQYKGTMPENTTVDIREGTLGIAGGAFRSCYGLNSVTIPYGVKNIGKAAFYSCYRLPSIIIPSTIEAIGDNAFYYCSNLTSVTVEEKTPLIISNNTFSNRKNATLNVPVGSKPAYEAADCWKEFREIVELKIEVTDITQLENAIYVEPAECLAGATVELPVKLKNGLTPVGCSFTLALPGGGRLEKDADGDVVYELADRARKQWATLQDLGNGEYKCTLTPSTSAATITGSDGMVITLRALMPEGMAAGDYRLLLANCLLQDKVDGAATDHALCNVTTLLTVADFVLGDVNGDGTLTSADAAMTVSQAVGQEQTGFNVKAADMNGDEKVTITDAVIIIDRILKQEQPGE